MIHLDRLAPAAEEGWSTLFQLAEGGTDSWMVIGGQMMHLLAAEHGATETVRPTNDVDLVVNVRTVPGGTEMLGAWLLERGFTLDGINTEGIGHRFVRDASGGQGRTIIDVLAPEGLNRRTKLYTIRPAFTVQTPGSVQAFQRSDTVQVTVSGTTGQVTCSGAVRRPGLLGALILKAAATTIPGRTNPERDWQDVCLLLALIADPISAAAICSSKDRRRLRALLPLKSRDHAGWANLDDEAYRRGTATFGFLLGRGNISADRL